KKVDWLNLLSFGTDTEGVKRFRFSYCLASAPSSLVPNNLPPRSASTSAGEEHLASRADRGASAFRCGRFVLFSFQRTFATQNSFLIISQRFFIVN
ncbi:hypothetical protein, partial [Parageobacillus toebii]|uniref:hypothetical protein n=1 Tax=Parageobacillus toebii TaxID=153151 RepID=UPI003D2DCB25